MSSTGSQGKLMEIAPKVVAPEESYKPDQEFVVGTMRWKKIEGVFMLEQYREFYVEGDGSGMKRKKAWVAIKASL